MFIIHPTDSLNGLHLLGKGSLVLQVTYLMMSCLLPDPLLLFPDLGEVHWEISIRRQDYVSSTSPPQGQHAVPGSSQWRRPSCGLSIKLGFSLVLAKTSIWLFMKAFEGSVGPTLCTFTGTLHQGNDNSHTNSLSLSVSLAYGFCPAQLK